REQRHQQWSTRKNNSDPTQSTRKNPSTTIPPSTSDTTPCCAVKSTKSQLTLTIHACSSSRCQWITCSCCTCPATNPWKNRTSSPPE
ncbi:hypothetical protein BGZ51_006944, partial [Haplosporangium sp. Z 767]